MKDEKHHMVNYYFAKELNSNLMSEGYSFDAAARLEPLKDSDSMSHILAPPRNRRYISKLQKNQDIPYRAIPDYPRVRWDRVISMQDFFIGNSKNVNV